MRSTLMHSNVYFNHPLTHFLQLLRAHNCFDDPNTLICHQNSFFFSYQIFVIEAFKNQLPLFLCTLHKFICFSLFLERSYFILSQSTPKYQVFSILFTYFHINYYFFTLRFQLIVYFSGYEPGQITNFSLDDSIFFILFLFLSSLSQITYITPLSLGYLISTPLRLKRQRSMFNTRVNFSSISFKYVQVPMTKEFIIFQNYLYN